MRTRPALKGFSLVEAALVIGIVGLIVGGTAVAMSSVRQAQLSEQTIQQIYTFLDNYRTYYAARAMPACTFPDETDAATYTATLRRSSVFPEAMCSASCVTAVSTTVKNAYGGTITAQTDSSTGTCEMVLVKLTEVAKKGCGRLLSELSDRYRQVGLMRTRVNMASTRLYNVDFPLSISKVSTDCSSQTSNSMDLYFKIRN